LDSLLCWRKVWMNIKRCFIGGLGHLLESLGSTKEALAAYEAALDIHPNLAPAKQAVQRLSRTSDGSAL
ncbi:MAG: hypothetical protein AAGJ50_03675, partial [Pseudomonadota bacterium]